jgi:hypothetical protein
MDDARARPEMQSGLVLGSSGLVRGGEMEETVPVGIYWHPAVWDLARSAYVADLDTDTDSPGSFVGWLDHVLERHASRSAAERAALAEADRADATDATTRRSFNKAHQLRESTVQAVEAAILADRRECGRYSSRSGFAKEAVVVAAEEARGRYGRDLPPPPAKLSNRPPRRRH